MTKRFLGTEYAHLNLCEDIFCLLQTKQAKYCCEPLLFIRDDWYLYFLKCQIV